MQLAYGSHRALLFWNYGYAQTWLSLHEWEMDFMMEKTSRDSETRGTPTAMEMDDNRARNNVE